MCYLELGGREGPPENNEMRMGASVELKESLSPAKPDLTDSAINLPKRLRGRTPRLY